jgi:hypothetical protein
MFAPKNFLLNILELTFKKKLLFEAIKSPFP